MKIATWNVNSLKVRLPHVLDWLESTKTDVLALQETKLTDEHFPVREINDAGYKVKFSGQKTYNGVALLSRTPLEDIATDIPQLPPAEHPERRILAGTVSGTRILNLYVVNGQSAGTEKYHYKLEWLNQMGEYVAHQLEHHERLVVLGDFNIAPTDADVHDPSAWHERILCTTLERDALNRLMSLGLVDVFRNFEQPVQSFSWWDYRAGAFRRNNGLRIDLILASEALSKRCVECRVDPAPRKLERPSDHAPVIASFQ